MFQRWLACTDQYAGQLDLNTAEELHLSKCLHLAQPLAECLEQNEEFYSKIQMYESAHQNVERENESEELKMAWRKLIHDVEYERDGKTIKFPSSVAPEIQVHATRNIGLVVFAPTLALGKEEHALILAYVKEQGDVVIAAAMKEDMEDQQDIYGGCALSVDIPDNLTYVTACAVYDTLADGSKSPIYAKVAYLPPRSYRNTKS